MDEDFPVANIRRALLEDTERAEGVAKAAWQLEDAMFGRLVNDYPSDLEARKAYFEWAKANRLYSMAIMFLYFVSIVEVPAWCNTADNFWTWIGGDDRCQVRGVNSEDLLLSTVPYLPPGWSLVLEGVLVYQIGVELLQRRNLQVQYFSPLQVQYFGPNHKVMIAAGLAMVAFEIGDIVFFILWRNPWRLAFIPRTAFMVFLPAVMTLFSSILTVLYEFITIAIFFVSGILLFAWVATMLFDDSEGEIYGESVTKGLDSFSKSLTTMFVAGSTDDFFECFRNTYSQYRVSGILWLIFLVIVHVLLLSLVLDTLVSAYTKLTETNDEEGNKEKVDGIQQAFFTLSKATGDGNEVSKAAFLEFAAEFSKSPRTQDVGEDQARIVFAKVDKDDNGSVGKEEFFQVCGAMKLTFLITTKDSPVKDVFPGLWNSKPFQCLKEWIDDGRFDGRIMTTVLSINLILVCVETTYDLNHIPEASYCKKLELIFSFIYLTECGLKLCVWSWAEYRATMANTFDFVTTWLLLGSSVLEEVAGSAGSLKRYMNVLRLLRLVRVIKQLKNIPRVIFMVSTITRLVTEAKDILTLLLVVVYFFTMLSVQLFGGLLYKTNKALEETEYSEADFWVLNFNDFLMAFGAWVVMLLCEFKLEFVDAIKRTSKIPGAWVIFYIFYVFAVSIIFELVKAFTIEVFVTLHRENHEKEAERKEKKAERKKKRLEEKAEREAAGEVVAAAEQPREEGGLRSLIPFLKPAQEEDEDTEEEEEEGCEGLKPIREKLEAQGKSLHCRFIGDPRQNERIQQALKEIEEEEEEERRQEEEAEAEEGERDASAENGGLSRY